MKKETMGLLIDACVDISRYFKKFRIVEIELLEEVGTFELINAVFAEMGSNEEGQLEDQHKELDKAIDEANTVTALNEIIDSFWERYGKAFEGKQATHDCMVRIFAGIAEINDFFERGKIIGINLPERPGIPQICKALAIETDVSIEIVKSYVERITNPDLASYYLQKMRGIM